MGRGTLHWLNDPEYRKLGSEHINQPRMSAETIKKLIFLKNWLTGRNRSVYEESILAEERKG